MKQFSNKIKRNGEQLALNMTEITQYHRISTESDEEDCSGRRPTASQIHKTRLNSNHNDISIRTKSISWNCECFSRLLAAYILLMIALGFAIHSMAPIDQNHASTSDISRPEEEHHSVYEKAAVAAGQEECSKVGVSILHEGGNAVDAAIATMLCQGVVEPQFSGIGGGVFMVIYNKTTNSSTIIDARETAPRLSTRDMLTTKQTTSTAPLSIGVPGELKGYSYAYNKYGGGVSWKRLFQDAIDKAENGVVVNEELSRYLALLKERVLKSKALCKVFCNSDQTDVKQRNDIFKNPNLAQTLRLISEDGVDSFYDSNFTDAVANDIRKDSGIISKKDFASYEVKERKSLKVKLSSDLVLHVPPSPSGGPVLSMIMSIIDQYHANYSLFQNNESLYWHRTVESFKFAFGKRTFYGDPDFVSDVEQLVINNLSPENITQLKQKIDDSKTFNNPEHYGAMLDPSNPFSSSTSHLSVLAPNGDSVSLTSSINSHFGSLFMSHGVLFNNHMDDFSTDVGSLSENETIPNMIEPGKRPLSAMSPCIVVNAKTNEVVYIIGAAGGRQIPTSVALSLLRLLYFGADDFDEAIRKPRLHHQLTPNVLYYEKEFDANIIKALQKKGHQVKEQLPKSHVNGIKNHVSHIHAFSDLRNEGAEADGW